MSLVLNVRGCWFKSCWCHFSWLNDKYLYFHGYLTCGSGSPVPYYSHRSGFQFWKYVNPQVRIRVTHGCTRAHPYRKKYILHLLSTIPLTIIRFITSSTRICSLSFVVISVPNSYYKSSGIHIFSKAMCMTLLVYNITVICTCLSQTVLTFPYHSIFEWAGSKWQIGDHGPESGIWCAYRCCFEWLTKI